MAGRQGDGRQQGHGVLKTALAEPSTRYWGIPARSCTDPRRTASMPGRRFCRSGEMRRTSRPVSRVLSPGRLAALTRRATIPLGLPLPTASCGLPVNSDGPSSNVHAGADRSRPPLDLAPGGVYRAAAVACAAGGLLHHRFTLTGRPRSAGGLFSVALSRGSPRVGVAHHLALWSPDFPRPRPRRDDAAAARPARPPCV